MRFARLSKKILMVYLSLYNTTYAATCKMIDSGLVTEKNVKVGKKRTRIYFHLEDKGRDHTTNYTKLIKICHWALIRFFTV